MRAAMADGIAKTYLRTGDLGYLDGHELYITGRLKDLVIIRGRNIYPQDVEAAVQRALPFVGTNSCVAFGIERDGQERLVVVVEANRDFVRLSPWATNQPGNRKVTERPPKARRKSSLICASRRFRRVSEFLRPQSFSSILRNFHEHPAEKSLEAFAATSTGAVVWRSSLNGLRLRRQTSRRCQPGKTL